MEGACAGPGLGRHDGGPYSGENHHYSDYLRHNPNRRYLCLIAASAVSTSSLWRAGSTPVHTFAILPSWSIRNCVAGGDAVRLQGAVAGDDYLVRVGSPSPWK